MDYCIRHCYSFDLVQNSKAENARLGCNTADRKATQPLQSIQPIPWFRAGFTLPTLLPGRDGVGRTRLIDRMSVVKDLRHAPLRFSCGPQVTDTA